MLLILYQITMQLNIEESSHGDKPWIITPNNEVIDYKLVFERETPYTTKDYKSLWQLASANDVIRGPRTNFSTSNQVLQGNKQKMILSKGEIRRVNFDPGTGHEFY